jgi:hypothetical protein
MRALFATAAIALSACATIGAPLPPTATPQQLHDRVGAFAQPTADGRLAVLKAQLDAAGLPYAVEEFDGAATGRNVVVRTGPATGKEILLVAHYDAVVLPGGKLADGAVDNAASVVSLIEATKRVAARTKHPVTLFLTDQEELGLRGARAFVKAHGVDNLAAVINLDVNGDGETLMYGLNNGAQSAFMIEAVRGLCVARAMSCLDFPKYPPSDDLAFSGAGAPTISLGHQPRAEAEKLRNFMLGSLDPAAPPPVVLALIHTPNDTIARVEAATLAQSADFVVALVMKLDAELP